MGHVEAAGRADHDQDGSHHRQRRCHRNAQRDSHAQKRQPRPVGQGVLVSGLVPGEESVHGKTKSARPCRSKDGRSSPSNRPSHTPGLQLVVAIILE